MSIARTLLIILCLVVMVTECRRRKKQQNKICSKGWKHYCGDKTKCVKPMSELNNLSKTCLRKGGIPGFIACAKANANSSSENHGRMCVQDLTSGGVAFAKNLMKAMQALESEDGSAEDEEDNGEEFVDLE